MGNTSGKVGLEKGKDDMRFKVGVGGGKIRLGATRMEEY